VLQRERKMLAQTRSMPSLFSGQASRPYKSNGTDLLGINCRVTSSEAILPILPNMALAEW